MYRSGCLERIARYLALHALAGNPAAIDALHLVLVDNVSPGRAAAVLGIGKGSVKGYLQRAREACGSTASAARAVALLAAAARGIPSVFVRRGARWLCTACGSEVEDSLALRVRHLVAKHGDMVSEAASSILRMVVAVGSGGGARR